VFGLSRRITGKQIYAGVVSIAWTLLLSRNGICSDGAQSISPMPAGLPGAYSGSAINSDVVPGQLEEKRRWVLAQIMAAKSQGCGIAAYLGEFNRIEDMVKGGQPYAVVDERLDKLRGNLDEQLKRAQVLKVQRPVPAEPPPPPLPPESSNSSASNPQKGGGESQDRTIDQIKERFGNKLPGDLGTLDNLSPELKDKFLKGDQGKDLLKKFLGN